MTDPIVEEVRRNRMKHTKEFNFDIHAICNDVREYQKELTALSYIDKDNQFTNSSH